MRTKISPHRTAALWYANAISRSAAKARPDVRFLATLAAVLVSLGLVGTTQSLWAFPNHKLPQAIEVLLPLLRQLEQPLLFMPLVSGAFWILWIRTPEPRRAALCIGLLASLLTLVCLYYHVLMVNLQVWPELG